ncbi:hypothetical protein J3B02_003048 [Coemansia erecta]|uniref:Alpha N-terminal protein methyltransferase 1 n=1 Tax=Coemansia asiatica TaxID=1052880 RepID=A0A9W7XF24_9FUNG|nr:hypothetical protein LPJ64_005977 [Coemansia asiatica]KAJ2853639.1 hypothetical protein J3B02_003048 [Coemansia erecta]
MCSSTNTEFRPTQTWYEDADKYWKSVPSSVNGMLGGLEEVHRPDIRDSLAFLDKLRADPKLSLNTTYACDCGAGIGRVTKHFLTARFDKVDLVEQNSQFLEAAANSYLKEEKQSGKVVDMFPVGLQQFTPVKGRYDVIWCQWVLSHLTDEDLAVFLKRCAERLAPRGIICVKENVATKGYVIDRGDSSVTRPVSAFENIFRAAGMSVVAKKVQTNFPSGLFEVNMWALQPNQK